MSDYWSPEATTQADKRWALAGFDSDEEIEMEDLPNLLSSASKVSRLYTRIPSAPSPDPYPAGDRP